MNDKLDLYLVEQDVTGLLDEYFTDAVIAAASEKAAIAAAVSLSDSKSGFGITVEESRLSITKLGPLEVNLEKSQLRHRHKNALVIVAHWAEDYDH